MYEYNLVIISLEMSMMITVITIEACILVFTVYLCKLTSFATLHLLHPLLYTSS